MTFPPIALPVFSKSFKCRAVRSTLNVCVIALATSLSPVTICAQEANEHEQEISRQTKIEFFEKQIRPVLVEHCSECHGAEKQEAGLRVDSLARLLEGGDNGPAIVPFAPLKSLLVQAIRHEDDLAMPPEEKLADLEIAGIEQWIRDGAIWPSEDNQANQSTIAEAAKSHWAFQRVKRVEVPMVNDAWIGNPIDAFVLQKLRENGLYPAEVADRKSLIRRVCYTTTGLPPTAEQVAQFVASTDPHAYEELVERLLDSPAYGEHWGRHWLDVARYSDTKGYVYAREERFWTHASTYRDWVIRALNDDMPYDRFLLLQIAADQVPECPPRDLAAMGFLTLGRRFLGVRRDVIDDRIDVLTRGTMGLTVNCARCHDHKYDPIPTADYYSLYGVFDSCVEQQQLISENAGDDSFRAELQKRQQTLRENLAQHTEEACKRVRDRVADYLFAQSELHKFPADGFDQVFQKDDLLPAFVRNWSRFLRAANANDDSIFFVWHAGKQLPADTFAETLADVIAEYRSKDTANPLIVQAMQEPPKSFRALCDAYGKIFADVDQQWQKAIQAAATDNKTAPDALPDADADAIRKILYEEILYGVPGPCRIPEGPISQSEFYFATDALTELWKLQGEVDRWLNSGPGDIEVALVLRDQPNPIEPRIFRRGNPLKLGDDIPRQFLTILRGDSDSPFQQGSGRLELADAIIDPLNPLTARVIVNRVWTYHFGNGLVRSPSDFGLRCDPPSHPELLDWLTTEFIENGWSLKQLHRMILLSSTYKQASIPSADNRYLKHAMQVDPENRWLWRMNPRRLTFEELRDSMLQVTDALDGQMGGRATDLFKQPFSSRRTVYGLVDRQFFATTLRVFDFANPDLHVAQRNETTVPQQALFFLNHPMVLDRAKMLAEQTRSEDPRQGIAQLYQKVFQRSPDPEELVAALELLQQNTKESAESESQTAKAWSYGFGALDESQQKVIDFTPLPHFSGDAWQGGPAYPDGALGWVQLNATGGHPGNTRTHACVRRWTAPSDMTVSLQSHWNHQPEAGDGIRLFVVSSMAGVLKSEKIHNSEIDLNIDSINLKAGEAIDFVVDIDEVLNSDQYLCSIVIDQKPTGNKNQELVTWNSQNDFPRNTIAMLDTWEQLAHVLLCTNEFSFVD
jgi:hypothetical protein